MSDKLKTLQRLKKILTECEVLTMYTKNKKTGWCGVASFWTTGDDMIRVNEGASDGSDDSDMTYEDFITNYCYKVGAEGGSYDE